MLRFLCVLGLLSVVILPCCAQQWTKQDSLRLQQMLNGEGELKLNAEALKEVEQLFSPDALRSSSQKSWLDFDESLPALPAEEKKTVRLTLKPYGTNIRYDWDPVYREKIKVTKDTYKEDPHNKLVPLLASVSKTNAEEPVAGNASGIDLMYPFTKEFWNVKGRKRKRRTLQVLQQYGDSTTVELVPRR